MFPVLFSVITVLMPAIFKILITNFKTELGVLIHIDRTKTEISIYRGGITEIFAVSTHPPRLLVCYIQAPQDNPMELCDF